MNNRSIVNNEKNAVIYCRVSTEEQAIKGESLPRQKELCLEFAKKHGYKVVAEFMEEGESGRRADRTQLTKMLAHCISKKNNISAVICLKSDRFARNIAVARNSEAMLNKSDVDLLFVLETNEKGANAKFMRNFFGLIAENESDVGSERTINGNIGAIQSGRWIKRLRGYSFKTNPYGKQQLYPNDDSIYISKIFELANKGIYKQTEIIEELKKDGFVINKKTLSKSLRNSVYCGLLPDVYNVNNGNYIKGIHEPIISEELYFSVQKILDGKKPNIAPRQKNNPMFPLRRYVVCSQCGKFMTAANIQGKSIKVPYYYCNHKGTKFIQKKVIETAYLEYLNQLQPEDISVNFFEETILSKFNEKTELEKIQKIKMTQKTNELKKEKSKLISLIAKGIIDEKDGQEELKRINTELADIENIFDSTNAVDINECWRFAKYLLFNIADMWKNGNLDLQQRIQGLITPSGFYFEENLIKPLKNPYLLSFFCKNGFKNELWGG